MFVFTSFLWAHAGHEHVSIVPTHVRWGLTGMTEMKNLHPIVVHFPIALLMASALFYLMGILFRKENFFFIGKWLLYFGTVGAAIAVWSGLEAAEHVLHNEEAHLIMVPHQYLGIGIFVLGFLFSLWLFFSKVNIPAKGRLIFLVGMLCLAAVITQQADFGGRLVFLHGVGVGKKNNAEPNHSEHHHLGD